MKIFKNKVKVHPRQRTPYDRYYEAIYNIARGILKGHYLFMEMNLEEDELDLIVKFCKSLGLKYKVGEDGFLKKIRIELEHE